MSLEKLKNQASKLTNSEMIELGHFVKKIMLQKLEENEFDEQQRKVVEMQIEQMKKILS